MHSCVGIQNCRLIGILYTEVQVAKWLEAEDYGYIIYGGAGSLVVNSTGNEIRKLSLNFTSEARAFS